MARKMTPSQYRNAVRRYNAQVDRANRANRKAYEDHIRKVNREIDRVNAANKRRVDTHNRQVRSDNQRRDRAIERYNQKIRAYNSAVTRDRNTYERALSRLKNQSNIRYYTVRNSAVNLAEQYNILRNERSRSDDHSDFLEFAENEATNSVGTAAALENDDGSVTGIDGSDDVSEMLSEVSADYEGRWKGALFSLSPNNPDAARHFCTSVREIFAGMMTLFAPDKDVRAADPNCDLTPNGTPSRRAKISYLMKRKGLNDPRMIGFVDADIDDVINLFGVFNKATHGKSGAFPFSQLLHIKRRAEGALVFLGAIAK